MINILHPFYYSKPFINLLSLVAENSDEAGWMCTFYFAGDLPRRNQILLLPPHSKHLRTQRLLSSNRQSINTPWIREDSKRDDWIIQHYMASKDHLNFCDQPNFTNAVPFSGGRREGLMRLCISAQVDTEKCLNHSYMGLLRINSCV